MSETALNNQRREREIGKEGGGKREGGRERGIVDYEGEGERVSVRERE
jgi:hypothetical protein